MHFKVHKYFLFVTISQNSPLLIKTKERSKHVMSNRYLILVCTLICMKRKHFSRFPQRGNFTLTAIDSLVILSLL